VSARYGPVCGISQLWQCKHRSRRRQFLNLIDVVARGCSRHVAIEEIEAQVQREDSRHVATKAIEAQVYRIDIAVL
jgi:hypothetical protein